MLLELSKIHGGRDHLDRRYPASTFASWTEDFRVASDVELSVDVQKSGEEVRLVGRMHGVLEMPCSRCLEPLVLPVDQAFTLKYVPASANVGTGELEVVEEELDAAYYEGDAIDLAQLIREQFYLALPMKPLCTPGCKGLCPVCGTNLNVAACACDTTWRDPRLEGLKRVLPSDD